HGTPAGGEGGWRAAHCRPRPSQAELHAERQGLQRPATRHSLARLRALARRRDARLRPEGRLARALHGHQRGQGVALDKEGIVGHRYGLFAGDQRVGEIKWAGRAFHMDVVADLPNDMPLETQVFLTWLALWRFGDTSD